MIVPLAHSYSFVRALLAVAFLSCTGAIPALAGAYVQDWTPELNTFTSSGKGLPVLNGYKEAVLLDHKGHGCLTHMWFGGDWQGYEKTEIRVYVDGETTPSIAMQLGMSSGVGFADQDAVDNSPRMGKTGNNGGIYNTYRIPYGTSVRVTAQRSPDSPDGEVFWWIIRGTDGLRASIGGVRLPDKARLKLYTVYNYTAKPLEEVTMCDIAGTGAVYETVIAGESEPDANGNRSQNWMEGCVRGYFDGSPDPVLLSSGFEDYFTGTYYFQRGKYNNSLAGMTHFDGGLAAVSAYRFHDEDPLFFQKGLRMTCRAGDTEHGTIAGPPSLHPLDTTFSTYVWVYQW